MRKFVSRSPINNEVIKTFEFLTDSQLSNQLVLAKKGYDNHKKLNFKQRSDKLIKLSDLISANADKYAELITTEIGKPITQSLGEVKKSAAHCRYYADNLEKILKIERVKTDAKKSLVIHEPLGTIYQISPFNFPFWLVFKGIIPIMAAGNGAFARPSDSTPLVGLAVEELFREAGFDSNEYQNVFSSPQQLEQICSSKYIQGVSFTGSSQAGSAIASVSGKYLKKSIMELGGSDPFIVLGDADLDLAVELAVKSRIANAGQVCISAKRFIITDLVYDKFVEKLLKRVQDIKIGDPFNPQTELGPMARSDLLTNIQKQIKQGVEQGGKLLYGGDRANIQGLEKGNFITPAIIEINPSNILGQQETFGPVFALIRCKNEKEAIKISNESDYGLGGTIISRDVNKAEDLAKQLETGSVFINEVNKTDSRVPSGGCKSSGYGRECSHFGAYEFTNIKTVWIS